MKVHHKIALKIETDLVECDVQSAGLTDDTYGLFVFAGSEYARLPRLSISTNTLGVVIL